MLGRTCSSFESPMLTSCLAVKKWGKNLRAFSVIDKKVENSESFLFISGQWVFNPYPYHFPLLGARLISPRFKSTSWYLQSDIQFLVGATVRIYTTNVPAIIFFSQNFGSWGSHFTCWQKASEFFMGKFPRFSGDFPPRFLGNSPRKFQQKILAFQRWKIAKCTHCFLAPDAMKKMKTASQVPQRRDEVLDCRHPAE